MASTRESYVPASKTLAEPTVGAVILGCTPGLVFAATRCLGTGLPSCTENAAVAMAICALLLAIPLYRVARRKAE
jgi:hypothetical protein